MDALGFAAECFYEEDLVVLMSGEHRLAQQSQVQLRDLQDDPLVLPRAGSEIRRQIDRAFSDAGIEGNIAYSVGDPRVSERLAALNLGVAIVPLSTALETRSSLVSALPNPRIVTRVGMLWQPKGQLRRAVTAFIEFVRRYYLERSSGPTLAFDYSSAN
jgi:DNA-binding transcriptional LysR family regulator